MDRRKLLAVALFALLAATAGCSAQGSLSMDPVDDDALAERASHDVDGNDPGGDQSLVRGVIENGSATAVDRRPPVDQALPFRYEGGFYNITYTESGTQPGYDGQISIDYNASSVDGEVIAYEELPEIDRAAFATLLPPPDIPEDGLRPGYDLGAGLTYAESEANVSVLVPTQEYDAVRYEGEIYPIGVEASRETLTVYRYESTPVAESAAEYAATLRENHEFELSGLPEAERDVVEGALNGTNYIEDDDNDGFDALVDRFRTHRPVLEEHSEGYYVVRYEGRLYWAEMDYGSYLDE